MDMSMSLHFGVKEEILFSFWKTTSAQGMVGSMLIVFIVSILFEAIKAVRYGTAAVHRREQAGARAPGNASSESGDDVHLIRSPTGFARRVCSTFRLIQALLYAIQAVVAYALMLVVMTFNAWLIMAVVAGLAVGYLLFIGTPLFDADLSDCC